MTKNILEDFSEYFAEKLAKATDEGFVAGMEYLKFRMENNSNCCLDLEYFIKEKKDLILGTNAKSKIL